MKYSKIFLIAAVVLLVAGCKKDKKTEVKDYMDGVINISFPKYVSPGYSQTYNVEDLMTLSIPEGGALGYFVKNVDAAKSDTLVTPDGTIVKTEFTVTAPQEIGSKSFMVGAFATKDYYSSSQTCSFTVVRSGFNGNASITAFPASSVLNSYTDSRDNRNYYFAKIGAKDWMTHNLSWADAGQSYEECEVMDEIFGKYYTWTEAQNACPDGWRLPSAADVEELASVYELSGDESGSFSGLASYIMGDLEFNGVKMWEYFREVKINNMTGLSIIPTGYMQRRSGGYKTEGVSTYAGFWASDAEDDQGALYYIYQGNDVLHSAMVSKTDFLAPVRCVR